MGVIGYGCYRAVGGRHKGTRRMGKVQRHSESLNAVFPKASQIIMENTIMLRTMTLAFSLLALSSFAFAQDVTGWVGEASLTANRTTGNTDTTNVGVGLKLDNVGEQWRHKFVTSADYGTVNSVRNRERFNLGYQMERDISDRIFGFGTADYYYDDFGAFTDGYFVGGGLGYTIYEGKPIGWSVTTGVGYRSQTSALDIISNEFAVNAESDFDWKINEQVSAYNDSGVLWSDSDTYLWSEAGLTANLMGNLAALASFRIDHHSDVPFGTEKTDTITRFGIVYTID